MASLTSLRVNPYVEPTSSAIKKRFTDYSQSDLVRALRSKGNSVLCIDAFQTGSAKTSRGELGKYFLTFNRSDDMNRVQDILTAISFLKTKTGADVHVEESAELRYGVSSRPLYLPFEYISIRTQTLSLGPTMRCYASSRDRAFRR
ncbi:MAG TPA: hypothetical protein VN682_05715 [Terriglobales bacterium]|nr:hypothetical protein [Terriglobales bacterium]